MKYFLGLSAYFTSAAASAFAYEAVRTVGRNIRPKSQFERLVEKPEVWVIAGLLVVLIIVVSNNSSNSNSKNGE